MSKQELKKYFFDDVNDLVAYLYTHVEYLSPIKLQKGLYFLYAYYAAMYGVGKSEAGSRECDYDFPAELFCCKFEAWDYGPVIRSVYEQRREREEFYQEKAKKFVVDQYFSGKNKDIKLFIDGLFGQIREVSDFLLVDRSHEDKSWQDAFNEGQSTPMSKESIKKEYQAKLSARKMK